MQDRPAFDSMAIVRLSYEGRLVGKGILTRVSGRRIHVSMLNRADRRVRANIELDRGSGIELEFRIGDLPPTPRIGGRIERLARELNTTELDVEILDWDKLAAYWRRKSESVKPQQ